MNNTAKDQFERLLRGAAQGRRKSAAEVMEGPSAAWLLARTARQDSISPDIFLVFRRGLAVASMLLIATGIFADHAIREHEARAMNLAGVAQFQIIDVFVP